jgi:hypothetical protein
MWHPRRQSSSELLYFLYGDARLLQDYIPNQTATYAKGQHFFIVTTAIDSKIWYRYPMTKERVNVPATSANMYYTIQGHTPQKCIFHSLRKYSNWKLQAARNYETLTNFYQTTWYCITEENNIQPYFPSNTSAEADGSCSLRDVLNSSSNLVTKSNSWAQHKFWSNLP